MNDKMRSWVMGMLLGQVSSPLPMTQTPEQKEPVAYLYNGVELPDINEVWTDELKAEYPYAHLGVLPASELFGNSVTGEIAILILTDTSAKHTDDGIEITVTHKYARYACSESQSVADFFAQMGVDFPLGEWVFVEDGTETAVEDFIYAAWFSYDILNTDGSVYLAASEPVPVYE